MQLRALLVFVIAAASGTACKSGGLTKHQLRECCMAGAFERCGDKGCINPNPGELSVCQDYQSCRIKCAGRNEYQGVPLDSHPNACAKLCAKRAATMRPSAPPRCPYNKQGGDLPEASDELDIGEAPQSDGPDLPAEQKPDLPNVKDAPPDLPGEQKPDLPSDRDRDS